jgi:hypothetical protein
MNPWAELALTAHQQLADFLDTRGQHLERREGGRASPRRIERAQLRNRRRTASLSEYWGDTSLATVNRHYFNLNDEAMEEFIDGWEIPDAEVFAADLASRFTCPAPASLSIVRHAPFCEEPDESATSSVAVIVVADPASSAAQAFRELARQVVEQLESGMHGPPTARTSMSTPTITRTSKTAARCGATRALSYHQLLEVAEGVA